jgi:hypothetical protein
MRLTTIESVVRAVLLLLPAIAALAGASVLWMPSKFPEISEGRATTFRFGLILAGLSTALFVVASADQLRTRQRGALLFVGLLAVVATTIP